MAHKQDYPNQRNTNLMPNLKYSTPHTVLGKGLAKPAELNYQGSMNIGVKRKKAGNATPTKSSGY
jgi:hypothetical protein